MAQYDNFGWALPHIGLIEKLWLKLSKINLRVPSFFKLSKKKSCLYWYHPMIVIGLYVSISMKLSSFLHLLNTIFCKKNFYWRNYPILFWEPYFSIFFKVTVEWAFMFQFFRWYMSTMAIANDIRDDANKERSLWWELKIIFSHGNQF